MSNVEIKEFNNQEKTNIPIQKNLPIIAFTYNNEDWSFDAVRVVCVYANSMFKITNSKLWSDCNER